MNIEDGAVRVLSGPNESVRYQGYKPDGTILYTRSVHEAKYELNAADLVMLDPSTLPSLDRKDPQEWKELGQFWGTECNTRLEDATATLVGARLTKEACLAIVARNYVGSKISKEKSDSLKLLCQKKGNASNRSTGEASVR